MSKSIKFGNNTYLDSTSIVHNKTNLNDYLEAKEIDIEISNVVNSGTILAYRLGNIVVVEVSDLKLKEDREEWVTNVAQNLPNPIMIKNGGWCKAVLYKNLGVIQINSSGLFISERSGIQHASNTYNGQLIYLTNENF